MHYFRFTGIPKLIDVLELEVENMDRNHIHIGKQDLKITSSVINTINTGSLAPRFFMHDFNTIDVMLAQFRVVLLRL